jgi:hypothetical protein
MCNHLPQKVLCEVQLQEIRSARSEGEEESKFRHWVCMIIWKEAA